MNTDCMQIVASEQNQSIQPNNQKKGKIVLIGIILLNLVFTFFMIRLFKCQTPNLKTNISDNQFEFRRQNQFIPVYIWQGPIPQKYVQKMRNLTYPFRLITNCDMLLNRMEQELDEKFSDFIYEHINEKTDVCKYIHLYYEGGLYLDMDTDLDYECMKNFVKDQTLFFEMNDNSKGMDLFTIYSSKPRNPSIKWSISFQNTFRSYSPYFTTLFYDRLDRSEFNVSKSNCIKHYSDRSWMKDFKSKRYLKYIKNLMISIKHSYFWDLKKTIVSENKIKQ